MTDAVAPITRLYLPLLAHTQADVREQAGLILLSTYGERSLTYLRRLTADADPQVRQSSRLALLALTELVGATTTLQPFRSMYVECLGRVQIYFGSYPMQPRDWREIDVGRVGWQKVLSVLAYLVHCGQRGASRTAIGEAVWGGTPGANSLTRVLSVLQQVIGARMADPEFAHQALLIGGDYCMLDPECYQCDVRMFERAYDLAIQAEQDCGLAHAAPLYSQAIQLYAGVYMADAPRGAGWYQARRDHLMNSFVLAAERLAEFRYSNQEYARCVTLCQSVLDIDDTADDVIVWLLRSLFQLGHTGEMIQTCQRYLRVTGLRMGEPAAEQDPVVQESRRLGLQFGERIAH